MYLLRLRESVRGSLWFVPVLFVVGAIALWIGMRYVDDAELVSDLPFGFGGGPEGAREVLAAISTSMIAFTGVVFSVTIVALQLASSQYSPRVLRSFLRDRRTQAALGSFIATFVYALLVLRGVRSPAEGEPAFVPRTSVSVAFVVLGVSLVLFIVYVHEISQSIRASRIVARIGSETADTLERFLVDDGGARRPSAPIGGDATGIPVRAMRAGFVQGYDTKAIAKLASSREVTVLGSLMVGDFVARGMTVFAVVPRDADGCDVDAFLRPVAIGQERTMEQDVRFGFRQLVDVGLRALSPGVNDPTTAVAAIDQLHDLLRRGVDQPFPQGVHRDEDGAVRFLEPVPSWGDLLDLSVTELRLAGVEQVQVVRRLIAMLDDLAVIAPVERRREILRQRALVLREPNASVASEVR